MDQICPYCEALEGYTPDDHPCIENLRKRLIGIQTAIKKAATVANPGWTASVSGNAFEIPIALRELDLEELTHFERDLRTVYEHMRSVTEFFSKQLEEAERKRDQVYGIKQEARKPLNFVRSAMRSHLEDVTT